MSKNTKKTIVILGTTYPFRGGGISTFNERIAMEFINHGHKVIIHTFKLQYPSFLFPGKTQYSTEQKPEHLDIHITVNSINPFNWIKIGRRIRKLNADFMLVRFWIPFMAPCLGTISAIVRKNKKTKVVSIADNVIPHEKRKGDKSLTKYFLKRVDAFIVMTKSVLEDLKTFEKKKPAVLTPHPLYDNFGEIIEKEEARKKLNISKDGYFVLFFGFIRKYKGLDILLKAFADERMKKMPVKLIVAGEFYANSKEYLDLIKELGIAQNVILRTDFIPNSEVQHYFCSADLVVQPYKSATQSGVTQVAYHFNKPMIVTDVGGLSEMVPHGKVGYVVPVKPESVAEAMVDFFSSPEKEKQMIEAVKEEKKKYSWEIMMNEILNI
jgi:D-inositol-3-phosphate glycosyltransferase